MMIKYKMRTYQAGGKYIVKRGGVYRIHEIRATGVMGEGR